MKANLLAEKSEYWKNHNEEQRRSGLSIRAYCDEHQLKQHCFGYWRDKFRRVSKEASHPKPMIRVVAKEVRSEFRVVARLRISEAMSLECFDWPEVSWLRSIGEAQ